MEGGHAILSGMGYRASPWQYAKDITAAETAAIGVVAAEGVLEWIALEVSRCFWSDLAWVALLRPESKHAQGMCVVVLMMSMLM